ncbi:vomeronasal type-1 receptor 90-like [Ctenodactylus gundi]
MNNNNKLYNHIDIRDVFFSEVVFGVLANTVLLLVCIFNNRPKPIDLPVGLLALVHTVMLLTKAFIAADTFKSQEYWNDLTCKSVVTLHRLMRGLSICATCMLSVLQAITLSPTSSCLAKFKHKSPHPSLCCVFLLWLFYMSLSGPFLFSISATHNVTSQSLVFVTKSCSLQALSYFLRHLFSILTTCRDACFMGLMSVSSGYMVTLLCRHKKQSRRLLSTSLSPKASPEQRATRTILLLMSFFVIMYILDSTISSSRIMRYNDPTRLCVQMLLANGYATVSPLVFISTKKWVINFLKSMWGGQ